MRGKRYCSQKCYNADFNPTAVVRSESEAERAYLDSFEERFAECETDEDWRRVSGGWSKQSMIEEAQVELRKIRAREDSDRQYELKSQRDAELQKEYDAKLKRMIEEDKQSRRQHEQTTREQERKRERAERELQKQLEKIAEQERRLQEEAKKQVEYEALIAPRPVPEAARLEHTVIVAGAGWGKTQLLQSIIAADIQKPDPPCLIILDSTGAMIDTIQRLEIFDGKLRDRILIVDPAYSPSLNMFDFSAERFNAYTQDQKEDVQTDITTLFNYIFDSGEYDLSGQMGTAFAYAVKLIMSRPRSTISDLTKLLEDTSKSYQTSPFKDDIEHLDHGIDFFKHHFFSDSLRATRASIARRIHSLLAVPAFRRMFTASMNTLDFYDEMNKGSIILVNTNVNLLKEDGMALFGRYIIARTLGAAFERAAIPFARRKPTYLIVDEAAPYFDETFEKLFTRARQFKLATVMAFQHLEQASDRLRSAIASSTRVKYAGGLGYSDRRRLAQDMETTPEFIASMKKDTNDPPRWAQFACYVRPDFPTACVMTVPFFQLENMPKMSEQAHQRLVASNKQRLTTTNAHQTSPPPETQRPSPPPPRPQPTQSQPSPRKPAPQQPPPQTDRLRDRTGALDWEVTVNPRIAEAGGEIPLVVQRASQPVKINVKIPPLTKNNTVLRLAGLGTFRPDKTRGDLYLTIKVPAYPEQNTDWSDKW